MTLVRYTAQAFRSSAMPSNTLTNYLRSARKKFGFHQKEIAILLGCKEGEVISRYERFRQMPGLTKALALELILQIPAKELFRGEFRKVGRAIHRRAKRLAQLLETDTGGRGHTMKLARLKAIISETSDA
jgi:transcriptional regulator with XRE-family HTH domain